MEILYLTRKEEGPGKFYWHEVYFPFIFLFGLSRSLLLFLSLHYTLTTSHPYAHANNGHRNEENGFTHITSRGGSAECALLQISCGHRRGK